MYIYKYSYESFVNSNSKFIVWRYLLKLKTINSSVKFTNK